jgi:hypothetical protein
MPDIRPYYNASGGQGVKREAEKIGRWEKEVSGNDIA